VEVALGLPLPAGLRTGVRIAWRPVQAPYGPVEQSAAGRRAAAAALTAAAAAESAVSRGADGRPVFPHGFAGSISHTDRLAVAVVAPGAVAVGVDIESADISPRVSRFVLRESERNALLAPGAEFTVRDLFAAKEAAFKALYSPDTRGELLFWRIELSRYDGALIASYRRERTPVWVHSGPDLSLAVALRLH
jgi:4'-phosphopantetheinyl transferase EntD